MKLFKNKLRSITSDNIMENLPKETLLTIISDLNNQLNKSKESNKKLKDENSRIVKNAQSVPPSELEKKIYQLQNELESAKEEVTFNENFYQDEIKSLKDELTQKNIEIYELNEQLLKFKNTDTSSVSSDETLSNMEKWGMTDKEKKNMVKFLKERCLWTEEPTEIIYEGKTYHVAGSSTRELHAEFRKWAQARGIPTKGQYRAIPCEPEFKKYVVAKHKMRYSNQPWRCSDTNQFPKFYNGSHTTPRINLKVNM